MSRRWPNGGAPQTALPEPPENMKLPMKLRIIRHHASLYSTSSNAPSRMRACRRGDSPCRNNRKIGPHASTFAMGERASRRDNVERMKRTQETALVRGNLGRAMKMGALAVG